MALTDGEIAEARKMLEEAARPLFFHDDDVDGVSSYVLCYQFTREGTTVCVKQSPILEKQYLRKVDEYQPDLIVILDKPGVEEGFLDAVSVPVLWLDHHEPQTELVQRYGNVTYLNPRVHDDEDNRPTSYWAYRITGGSLWIATLGSVGDWHMPDYIEEFGERYPGYLPDEYDTVEDLYLDTKLGKLIQVLQFNLKGRTTDVRKSILTLTRIEHPDEILERTTPRGKYIWKKYGKHARGYDEHVQRASEEAEKEGSILLYEYDNRQTYTSELSNELLIRFPEKVILVCRRHDSKRKCSVRSKEMELPNKIHEALNGLDGRGGGHTNACGLAVADEDWDEFRERFEKLVG